jgi:thiol-disulfide isomerase/thioredoxin
LQVKDPSQNLEPVVGRWAERRLRIATRGDVVALAMIVLLGGLCIVAGRRAHRHVEPRAAAEVAELLDELELPLRLPNAPLVDVGGKAENLLDRIHGARAVVAFYAPWCGPCQKELPQLVGQVGDRAQVLVVISPDEDLDATKRALANLDLSKLGFFVDSSERLQKEGRVKALPTTFLIGNTGAVLMRTVGFSFMELYRLTSRLNPQKHRPVVVDTGDAP